MQQVAKYKNLKERFPRLQTILFEAIQNEVLDIQQIKCECERYSEACSCHPSLEGATCVIFSPHMSKNDHLYEIFIFVNDAGEEVTHISGREMELYGMIKPLKELNAS